MKIGELKTRLADLPDDMDITVDMGFGAEWQIIQERWRASIEKSKQDMISRGLDPNSLDKIKGPYETLHQSGLPRDLLFLSVSEPDYQNNRIALEM